MPLLPILIALICRGFGLRCKSLFVVFSVLLMIVFPDIAMYILDVTNHKGPPDYIHTIKSGYLMTFWFFALGVTFIGSSEIVRTTAPANQAAK